MIEKLHTVLLLDLRLLSDNKKFLIQWYLREVEISKNWPGDKVLKLRRSKFWERQFFSIATFK